MYVYYYRTYEKAVSGGGEREKGGHVLRDTTSRGLYVRVWPPHTSERRDLVHGSLVHERYLVPIHFRGQRDTEGHERGHDRPKRHEF